MATKNKGMHCRLFIFYQEDVQNESIVTEEEVASIWKTAPEEKIPNLMKVVPEEEMLSPLKYVLK